MPRAAPSVRLLPMSDRRPGFQGRAIDAIQRDVFLTDLPRAGGRWDYARAGLNAPSGTVVLFQFRASVIASATFLRDEPTDDAAGGTLCFDPASFRTFTPVDAAAMRLAWPSFRAFGHVKQFLNPAGLAAFRRRLRQVRAPESGLDTHATPR